MIKIQSNYCSIQISLKHTEPRSNPVLKKDRKYAGSICLSFYEKLIL